MCRVELLQAGDGLDVGVDAGQVAAVAGGQEAPVLQMRDRPLHRDPDRGELCIDLPVRRGQLSPGLLFDRGDGGRALVALVGNRAAAAFQQLGHA